MWITVIMALWNSSLISISNHFQWQVKGWGSCLPGTQSHNGQLRLCWCFLFNVSPVIKILKARFCPQIQLCKFVVLKLCHCSWECSSHCAQIVSSVTAWAIFTATCTRIMRLQIGVLSASYATDEVRGMYICSQPGCASVLFRICEWRIYIND